MYTGMKIDSAEALRIGLVDRVMPDAELWSATTEIARTISGNAPLAIQAAKITIAQVLKDPDQRDMNAIKEIGTACMDSEDFREGRRAFMEKRKPQFSGRERSRLVYSMTFSAIAVSVGGIVSPSAFAVLRLIASSYLFGA